MESVRNVLAALHLSEVRERTGWVTSACPLAPWRHSKGKDRHPSFGVTTRKGKTFAYCYSCGFRGTLDELIWEVHACNSIDGYYPPENVTAALMASLEVEVGDEWGNIDYEQELNGGKAQTVYFDEDWLANFHATPNHPYLAKRGVESGVGAAMDVRHDFQNERICFPVRAFDGKLVGMQGRALNDAQEPRYYHYRSKNRFNPHVWLGENDIDLEAPVVLVEGPLDRAKTLPVTANVLASMGPVTAAKLKRIALVDHVITFFDEGTGGDRCREAVDKYAGAKVMARMELTAKDPGDMNTCDVETSYANALSGQ